MDCLFCKIVNGEIPVDKMYEDDTVVAFRDINPVAPVHVLIIPKIHIESVMKVDNTNIDVIGNIFNVATKIAKDLGIDEGGFRIVNNCGEDGGQSVKHLHFHLIGGRIMNWPPG